MARLTAEQVNKIKDKYGVDTIWSYSRINTFQTSKYEYLLKYIKHIEEDRQDSIYTFSGTLCHDLLDKFYEGEIDYHKMIDEFEDGWLLNRDILQLKFDRNDQEKDKSIGDRYYANLQSFFKNHTVYEHKLMIEKPVVINANNNIFLGYIDGLYKDDNGDITLIDFKTSSLFRGKSLDEHSQQLQLYSLGIHQATGLPLSRIHACFNFLKYADVEYTQANGVKKVKTVERSKLGESLQSNLRVWIKKLGYENEMDEFLKMVLDDNDIKQLPENIQNMYTIKDCHVYVDTSEEAINKLVKDISIIIKDIEARTTDFNETGNDRCFWDDEESLKEQSYYYSTLCSYSINKIIPYKELLEKIEQQKNGSDLFSGIGSSVSTTKSVCNNKNETDLSWLSDI